MKGDVKRLRSARSAVGAPGGLFFPSPRRLSRFEERSLDGGETVLGVTVTEEEISMSDAYQAGLANCGVRVSRPTKKGSASVRTAAPRSTAAVQRERFSARANAERRPIESGSRRPVSAHWPRTSNGQGPARRDCETRTLRCKCHCDSYRPKTPPCVRLTQLEAENARLRQGAAKPSATDEERRLAAEARRAKVERAEKACRDRGEAENGRGRHERPSGRPGGLFVLRYPIEYPGVFRLRG